jgi:tRNA (guanine-N7-)-methyltransferase
MPHFTTQDDFRLTVPVSNDLFEIEYFATNNNETLFLTKTKNERFFIQKLKRESDYIVKIDKLTKVANTPLLHEVLKEFAKITNATILQQNIFTKKAKKADEFGNQKSIEYFLDEFKYDKEIEIEIGFGSGRHLLYQAKNNSNKLFIGLEIHAPSIRQLLKQCKLQEIDNILVLNYDARIFLEILQSNKISKIYIHFPVPWDKQPNRRVMGEEFLAEAFRVLKKGGKIELRSDSQNYVDYTIKTLNSFKVIEYNVRKNFDLEVSSKYEDRWRRLGKDIYDITIISHAESIEKIIKDEFLFEDSYDTSSIYESFKKQKIVEEDFFINLESIYKTSDNGVLIKLSFGAFSRHEHCYLHITKDFAKYEPKNPAPTKSNQKAHNKIKELIGSSS